MNDKLERQRQHFNNISLRYKEARESHSHLELKRLIWNHAFAAVPIFSSNDQKPHDYKVLEPMCGFAEGKAIIARVIGNEFQYFGFDYSDSVVEDLQKTNPEAHIIQADVTTFTTDETFDLVILIGGLHHVPDYAEIVVKNISAFIKPGGYFVNLEPTHGNPLFKWVRDRIYAKNSLFDEDTERAFPVRALQKMFEEAGLSKSYISYPGLLAYVLYYNPDAFPALNKGSVKWVQRLFNLEKPFYSTRFARWFSFATLSVWQRPS